MGRKGSAQGGHTAGGKPAFGGGASYRLEGLLGPRVEDYVKAHGDFDTDELVEYLRCVQAQQPARISWCDAVQRSDAARSRRRSSFREYQRKQVNALRKARAAAAARRPMHGPVP